MTLHGYIKNGKVVVEEPIPVPDGTAVEISLVAPCEPVANGKRAWQLAVEAGESVPIEEWDKLPTDGAANLDHYLYGTPKRSE